MFKKISALIILCFFIGFLCVPLAFAKSKAGVAYNLNDGNENSFTGSSFIETLIKKDGGQLEFNAEYMYNELDHEKDNQRFDTSIDIEKNLQGNFYLSTGYGFFYNEATELEHRSIVSVCPGYKLIKSKKTSVSLEVGQAYSVKKENNSEYTEEFYHAVWGKFSTSIDNLEITGGIRYLADHKGTEDNYIIQGEVDVDVPVYKNMLLRLSIADDYNNRPAKDKEQNDIRVSTAIAYSF